MNERLAVMALAAMVAVIVAVLAGQAITALGDFAEQLSVTTSSN